MKIGRNSVAASSLKSGLGTRPNMRILIAYSWCRDTTLAVVLAQEAIFKAIKNAAKLRDVGTIDTWLYRILFNCWQDYLRVKGRNVEFVEMHDDDQPEHAESYQQSQIVDRVRASIDQLPMQLREVVTLADFAGLSYAGISGIIDVPIGTVMSRLFRARQNLKQQLLDFGSEELAEFKLRRIK